MRTAAFRMLAAVVTSATLACQAPTDAASSGAPAFASSASIAVHQVTGGGKLDISQFDPGQPPETYAFNASVDADGHARGEIQIRFSDPALNLHAVITCLSVNGSSAWLGGVITHTADPAGHPEGREFWVHVQDNGHGGRDPADRMGFVFTGAPAARCLAQPPRGGLPFPLAAGNIQVR